MIKSAFVNPMAGAPSAVLPLILSKMTGNIRQYAALAVASLMAVGIIGKRERLPHKVNAYVVAAVIKATAMAYAKTTLLSVIIGFYEADFIIPPPKMESANVDFTLADVVILHIRLRARLARPSCIGQE
jgi:hypothetical protein